MPAWLRPYLPTALAWPLFGVYYWLVPLPSHEWFALFWTAYPLFSIFAVWCWSVAAFDVDADRLVIRRHLRSVSMPMQDVLRVDARRNPWKLFAPKRPPPYTLDLWLSSFRHVRLPHIESGAADRLLAVLNGYHRPVWISPPT